MPQRFGLENLAANRDLWLMKIFSQILFVMLLSAPASADERSLQFLEDRYTHAFLHQVGPVAEGTPPALGRADCIDKRPLSRHQRNHARAVGRMFERSGIHLDLILSSRWCQAIATSQLLKLRPVTEEPILNLLGEDADAQVEATLDLMDGIRPKESALMVTHGANIKAVTGLDTQPGEVVVVRLKPGQDLEIRGRFHIE